MKARIKIASAQTPDGSDMVLYQCDGEYSILVDGAELMSSMRHESELELARLGCASLTDKKKPRVLIGGLGLGYTLSETLKMLGSDAEVVVGELMECVIEWNCSYFGELNNHPLQDKRVSIHRGDVVKLIFESRNRFDAILLDIDNGPDAMTDPGNQQLYNRKGRYACKCALKNSGCLAIWSAVSSPTYEQSLMKSGFYVRCNQVPAYKGCKSKSHVVWVASENEKIVT